MERKLVRQYPLICLSLALIGAAAGALLADLNFTDPHVRLGARVLFGLLGFMTAYGVATWFINRQVS